LEKFNKKKLAKLVKFTLEKKIQNSFQFIYFFKWQNFLRAWVSTYLLGLQSSVMGACGQYHNTIPLPFLHLLDEYLFYFFHFDINFFKKNS
jgi:hypothetical protein